jgi:hypothetical protein
MTRQGFETGFFNWKMLAQKNVWGFFNRQMQRGRVVAVFFNWKMVAQRVDRHFPGSPRCTEISDGYFPIGKWCAVFLEHHFSSAMVGQKILMRYFSIVECFFQKARTDFLAVKRDW